MSEDDELTPRAAENLTRGPPQVLHVCVYQRRAIGIMADPFVGEVEVPLAAMSDAAQLVQWLPLRMAGSSAWFIHVRVSLHFALMRFSPGAAGDDDGNGAAPHRRGAAPAESAGVIDFASGASFLASLLDD